MRPRPASNDPAAIPPSLLSAASQPNIDFVHPGYDGDFTSTTFLSLPRLDDGGVCFDTALAACGLIACNQWSGFFSTDKPGQLRVDRPLDGILRDRQYYYFHLPASRSAASDCSSDPPSLAPPYPITPRFSDWSFPHHDLPPHWSRLQLQTNLNIQPIIVGQRASFCVATNYSHGVDVAHCVPSNEREWWDLNRMDRYSCSSTLLFSTQPQDSPANLVPLRSDFHRVFDERHLCFVPKAVEGSDSDSVGDPLAPTTLSQRTPQAKTRLLIHVVVPSPNGQVAGLWHNRALHALPPGLSKECLFARFAYTIFSPAVFSSAFLSGATVARRLSIRDPETQIPGVRMESPANCWRILRTARSRSPRKRSAPPPGEADDDGCGAEGNGAGKENGEQEREEEGHGAIGGDYKGFGDGGYLEQEAPFDSPGSGLLAQFGPDPAYAMAEENNEEKRGRGRKRAFEATDEEVNGLRLSRLRRQRF
ncbi:hypothetical protein BT67DRAFT_400508 [Trichocladium antarcticum]|uniref:HNH nuclease domain-containing protein n=1 Tax=Trichocladium antarcticum TaxID=1450529 RepID=A0AAN6ZDM9_9PEZI|nr:hypothetical protein BT67DRAFT_400508 [Trichocladium antarcticum]